MLLSSSPQCRAIAASRHFELLSAEESTLTFRREAGRVYVDAAHSAFSFSVLRCVGENWHLTEGTDTFERFEDAESALLVVMTRASAGKAVRLVDVAPRSRFGKGRVPSTQKIRN